jgi:hypothetical protein
MKLFHWGSRPFKNIDSVAVAARWMLSSLRVSCRPVLCKKLLRINFCR